MIHKQRNNTKGKLRTVKIPLTVQFERFQILLLIN